MVGFCAALLPALEAVEKGMDRLVTTAMVGDTIRCLEAMREAADRLIGLANANGVSLAATMTTQNTDSEGLLLPDETERNEEGRMYELEKRGDHGEEDKKSEDDKRNEEDMAEDDDKAEDVDKMKKEKQGNDEVVGTLEKLRNELQNLVRAVWGPVLADLDKILTDGLQRARDVARDAINTWSGRSDEVKGHMSASLRSLFPDGDEANALYYEILASGITSEQQLARLTALVTELDRSTKTRIGSVALDAADVSPAAVASDTDGAKKKTRNYDTSEAIPGAKRARRNYRLGNINVKEKGKQKQNGTSNLAPIHYRCAQERRNSTVPSCGPAVDNPRMPMPDMGTELHEPSPGTHGTGQELEGENNESLLVEPSAAANGAQPSATTTAGAQGALAAMQQPIARTLPLEAQCELAPAFNPAYYAITYLGPTPAPLPGQDYLARGDILPVMLAGQPVGAPPLMYAAVYPTGLPLQPLLGEQP
ncbi:uncharacterized protein B0T15DRAFT_495784 [Chaetomium strumarium]|uniref:Uncharacterized protein n=1 Tax=Chaetomium strumarium TaxID=1170767 RepID=A0AAJ0GNE8_9PEZI|nr:hypothetical protein B0T15DRAFT_495784 [Chaetomium strumarium]